MLTFNNRGLAIMGTMATMLIVLVLGLTIANIFGIGTTLMSLEVEKERARAIAMAGIEYGSLTRTAVTNQPFGGGAFTLTITSNRLTSVGNYGNPPIQVTYATDLTAPQSSCLAIDTSSASFNLLPIAQRGRTLSGLRLYKKPTCTIPISITALVTAWSTASNERLQNLTIGSTSISAGNITSGQKPVAIPNIAITNLAFALSWDKNMIGKTITFIFTMGDTTTSPALTYP